MNDAKLLVLERSTSILEANGTGADKYVLEGIFSEIGKKNKNNRIYDEKELMPHIEGLQEKLKSGKLLGELDHPKQFDISLQNVSHVIEEITYDKANKVVRGKIRLLDTTAGKQAQALVDGGIPIHISSRAAGVVQENGHVKIKKLFTYDLVADPGFENAELNRVNEQYGFVDDDNLGIFEINGYIEETNTDIQKELIAMDNTTPKETINEAESNSNSNFISVEDFNEYSKIVKENFDSLKSEVEKVNEASANTDLVKYSEAIAKRVNQIGNYVENLSENVDSLISHNDYIIENLGKVKDYAEYVGLKTDQNIEYSKHISENVNTRFGYQDYVNEQTDKVIEYSNYVMEGVDAVANYTEYVKDNVENLGKYQDYVSKTMNENFKSKNVGETINESETVKETADELIIETNTFKNELNEKISALVESAKKQKVDETSANTHFLHFVNEDRRTEYKSFDDETKAKVIRTFENKEWFGSTDASAIWESVFVEPEAKIDWLKNMPSKYKSSWDSINESQKSSITAQASVRTLDTQYKIDHFWSTRELRAYNPSEQINETVVVKESDDSSNYETSSAYMDTVTEELKRRFNK
jgi:hypothetical protein